MAEGKPNKVENIKELMSVMEAKASELKFQYKSDLYKRTIDYGETDINSILPPQSEAIKFASDSLNESTINTNSKNTNKFLSQEEFTNRIKEYNKIIDDAVSELATSIAGHSNRVQEHVEATATATTAKVTNPLEDYVAEYIESIEKDTSPKLNSNGKIEDLRYSVLEHLRENENNALYESWDLNSDFIRTELVKGAPGEYSSEFLTGETINELNNISVLDKDKFTQYQNHSDNLLAIEVNKKTDIERLLDPNIKASDEGLIFYEKHFNEYMEKKRTVHAENNVRHDEVILSIKENEKKIAMASHDISKADDLAKAQLAILDATQEMDRVKNQINYEQEQERIKKITEKAINSKNNATHNLESGNETLDKLKTKLNSGQIFLDSPIEEQQRIFNESLPNRLPAINKTIKSISQNKSEMATFVSKDVNNFWENGKITFKEFTPEEFETAINTIENETDRKIIKGVYALDDVTNTYKKSPYLLRSTDSNLGLIGVENVTENPKEIAKYFSLTDHGNKEVDKYYSGMGNSSKSKAELTEIANKLREVKEQHKNMNLDERISVYKQLKDSFDNPAPVQAEVEAEIVNTTPTVKDTDHKPKEIVSGDGTGVFKWVNEDEAEILGKNSLSKLRGTTLGDELYNLSIEKSSVETVVDYNKAYIDVINKAYQNEDLSVSKARITTGLESISVLQDIDNLFNQGTPQSIAQGKRSLEAYSGNNFFTSSYAINSEMRAMGLYGTIKDVNNVTQLKTIVNNTVESVVNDLDKVDWDIIRTIQEKTAFEEKPDIISHFQESLSENRNDKIEFDREYNGGGSSSKNIQLNKEGNKYIRTMSGQYEGEESAWIKEMQKSTFEYDSSVRDFALRNVALENAKDEDISIIQKRQAEFVDRYIKKTHVPVRVQNLPSDQKGFTLEQLKKGFVSFKLDKNSNPVPVQHFSEFYSLMSLTKLDESRDKKKPFTKEEWSDEFAKIGDNNVPVSKFVKIGNTEIPINQFYEYYNEGTRKAQNDEIRAEIETYNNKITSKMEERKIDRRIKTEQLYDSSTPREVVDKAIALSDIEIEKEYSSTKLVAQLSDEISNADVESFYKYKQNDYLAATKKKRIMYIPKGADDDVIEVLNKIKNNSNNKVLHFKGDAVNYDIIDIGKDSVKIQPQDWIEANKVKVEFDFSDNFLGTLQKANDLEYEAQGNSTIKDVLPNKKGIDGKLIIGDTVYEKRDLYNKMTNTMVQIEQEFVDKFGNVTTDKAYINKPALKVIDTNFTWMRKDKQAAQDLGNSAQLALSEALEGLTDNEVNRVFNLHKAEITSGKMNVVDVVEEAMTKRLKGTMLNNYMEGSTDSSLIRAAKIAIEGEGNQVNTDSVLEFLRTMASTSDDKDLVEYYGSTKRVLNDREYLKELIQSDKTKLSPLALMPEPSIGPHEYDINDDDTRRKIFGEEVSRDYDESKFVNSNPLDDVDVDKKYRSDTKTGKAIKARQEELADKFIKDKYNYQPDDVFEIIKHKYSKRVATIKVDAEIDRLKKHKKTSKYPVSEKVTGAILNVNKRKDKDIKVSKTLRKKLINLVQTQELKNLNVAIDKANPSKGKLTIEQMVGFTNRLEKSSKRAMKDVLEFMQKNPKTKQIADTFIKTGEERVSSILLGMDKERNNIITKDFGVRLQAVSEHVEKNGSDSLIQYIQALSGFDENGIPNEPSVGISKLFSNKEIKELSENMSVTSLQQYKDLALLSDIIPGISVKVTATSANGNKISYDIKDSKPNYDGGHGLVVRDNETKRWLPIVDTSPRTNKPVDVQQTRSLATINIEDIYAKQKTDIHKIESPSIFLNAGKTKTSIMPNLNFDFDKVANNNNGYGSLSPVQTVVNSAKLLDRALVNKNGVKAMTFDFETSGLPDKLDVAGQGHLFQPVQATVETFDLTSKQGGGFETKNNKLYNFYVAPDDNLTHHMNLLYGEDAVETLAKDLKGNDTNLLKNYAKYSMPDAAYQTEIMDEVVKDAEGNEINKQIVALKKEVKGPDGVIKQELVKSDYTPESYVRELQSNAKNVVNFLRSGGEIGGSENIQNVPTIDPRDIYHTKQDFLSGIIDASQRNGKPLPSIGHNTSGADISWARRWVDESTKELKDSLIDVSKGKASNEDLKFNRATNTQIDKINRPFLTDNIDTMHLSKIIEPGYSKSNLIDSANRNDITIDGEAHLSDVDVPKTTQLFVKYAETDSMNQMRKGVHSSVKIGDIIVKSGNDSEGLNLERGIYKVAGFAENSEGATLNLLDLSNLGKVDANGVAIETPKVDVTVSNTASLQKDAMDSWTKFNEGSLSDAMKLHNDLEAVETNRTMKNAITNLDTWMFHKQTGEGQGYGKMLDTLNDLKEKFNLLEDKAKGNMTTTTVNVGGVEMPIMSNTAYTDEDKFLINNIDRFEGDGYVKELNRLSEEVPNRRLNANIAETQYMNSDEGKLVQHFLNESQDRLDAKVIDKPTFKKFNEAIRQTVHDVKLSAFQNGKMNDAVIVAPQKYNLGTVTSDTIKAIGGAAHGFGDAKLALLKPFDFTLDFTNNKTLSDSMWNNAGKLADNMLYNNQVASINEGRNVALNRYVMPLLQSVGVLPKDQGFENIGKIADNIIATDAMKVPVPDNMAEMVPVSVNYMMNHKKEITATLPPLQEVNMLKDTKGEVLQDIQVQLSSNLENLDIEAATIKNGEEAFYSPEYRDVQKELVKIAKINREDAVKATGGTYMPFYNHQIGSDNAVAYVNSLPSITEFNLKNPVSTELGSIDARQLKAQADSIVTDRQLLRPYDFRNKAIFNGPSKAVELMPEYMDMLSSKYGINQDHISGINSSIANDLEHKVYTPLHNAQVQAKKNKAQIYKELAHRASAPSKYNFNNLDSRLLTLDNADKTKFSSMKELGWAQQQEDGTIIAGKVGKPLEAARVNAEYPRIVETRNKIINDNAISQADLIAKNNENQALIKVDNDRIIAENKIKNMNSTIETDIVPIHQGTRDFHMNDVDIHANDVEVPKLPTRALDPSKVLITSSADVGLGVNGAVGFSYTDLSLNQLKAISENQFTNHREKTMISEYLKQDGIADVHTDAQAKLNRAETIKRRLAEQSQPAGIPESMGNSPDYISDINAHAGEGSRTPLLGGQPVTDSNHGLVATNVTDTHIPTNTAGLGNSGINVNTHNTRSNVNMGNVVNNTNKSKPVNINNVANIHNTHSNIASNGAVNVNNIINSVNESSVANNIDDVIPESHITQASIELRNTVKEVGGEARKMIGEFMNSKAMTIAGIGIAFAGAMALTKRQNTSDGGTIDEKANGDTAPRVDGTYAPEYNGSKHDNIPIPKQQKSVRVEENGTGMNVQVRAKNKGNIPDKDVQQAVTNAVNGTVRTDINIHQTDDRHAMDKGYVSNIFSQLLGGQ